MDTVSKNINSFSLKVRQNQGVLSQPESEKDRTFRLNAYILVLIESETKPGGFLRGKCFAAPLNSNSLYCSYEKSRYIKILTFKYEQYI
jgi:hypothetical protein